MIVNGRVLTMDPGRTVFSRGAVAITDGEIVDVGREEDVRSRFDAADVIDAGGGFVHPGFIDCHIHTTLLATRELLSEQLPRPDFTRSVMAWLDYLEAEDEYANTLFSSLELARNGITMFLEAGTIFEPDAAAQAVDEIGIRASLADPWCWDADDDGSHPAPRRGPRDTKASIARLGQQAAQRNGTGSRVRGHVAIYGGCTDELVLAAKESADAHDVAFTQHQSFVNPADDDERFGKHPLVHYQEIGALGPNCVFSHMNMLRPDEIAAVVDSGMSIAWCPVPYLNRSLSREFATSVPEVFAAGGNVGLGVDSPYSGFDFQGNIGYLVARGQGEVWMTAEDLLEMATIRGAQAAGVADLVGSLEVGKRADVVIRDADVPEFALDPSSIATLMLVTGTRSVKTVLVDGRTVVDGGRLATRDEAEVVALTQKSLQSMGRKLGITREQLWKVVD